MNIVNLDAEQKRSLAAVGKQDLYGLISPSIDARSVSLLYDLPLDDCGPYVSEKLRHFRRCVEDYASAKSSKKLESTRQDAFEAGARLSDAVSAMTTRMVEDAKHDDLHHVDDDFPRFRNSLVGNIEATVSFRWRGSVDQGWNSSSIRFHYQHVEGFVPQAEKRKLSGPKQRFKDAESRESRARDLWERGLYSVRDYFREGGDGAAILASFSVKIDGAGGWPNNYATIFWADR